MVAYGFLDARGGRYLAIRGSRKAKPEGAFRNQLYLWITSTVIGPEQSPPLGHNSDTISGTPVPFTRTLALELATAIGPKAAQPIRAALQILL